MLMVLSHFEEGGTNLTRHPQLLDLVRHNRWLEDSKLIGSRSLIVLAGVCICTDVEASCLLPARCTGQLGRDFL